MKRVGLVGSLLFASGLCALVYQVAWLREFRLIFGASTASSAAVLALFMGGLGMGGWALGRRADRHPSPLAFYGRLELIVAASAAVSPLLVLAVRALYLATGGVDAMGLTLATAVRILLSAAVLGVPTFFMGGTFPAAARAVEDAGDIGRRRLAVLYGGNTLGAVAGSGLCTFLLLETLGIHRTLWVASLVNLLVAFAAIRLSTRLPAPLPRPREAPLLPESLPAPPATGSPRPAARRIRFAAILVAAGLTGFVFFLMELVWYRMLAPILGGSVYTFGTILLVALFGIGAGGILNGLFSPPGRRPRWTAFALTCVAEGCFLALPLALGDNLAVFTSLLGPLGSAGFTLKCLTWVIVAGIVVLPASIVAGIQFPLLIALLGRGEEDVGRQTGLVGLCNTLGAITGSLAGGFGLLPLLGAVSLWRLSCILLVLMGVVGAAYALVSNGRRKVVPLFAAALGAVALALALGFQGPSSPWRHRGIGIGRAELSGKDGNQVQAWVHEARRVLLWEADGVESSIGLLAENGLAFVVNGKIDGNSIGDATTQVMAGLVSGALHPGPRRAAVIGLGTGSSVGWLARIPTMTRVDVIELEPAVLEVARRCGPVNQRALENPRVRVLINDAREVLLTSAEQYDLVVSEPSNPYRAGVASLYTLEFYRAVDRVLAPGGIFTQWVQAYEVDAQTIRTILATLRAVFPCLEIWQTNSYDLLILASRTPQVLDTTALRARLREEPFRTALRKVWRVSDLEGFLSRFVAGRALAETIAKQEGEWLNTDDCMRVEYGFARTAGRRELLTIAEIRRAAAGLGCARPALAGPPVDWEQVDLIRDLNTTLPESHELASCREENRAYVHALQAGDFPRAAAAWRALGREPSTDMELALVAEALAAEGDPGSLELAGRLRGEHPLEAGAVAARYCLRTGDRARATAFMASVLRGYHSDPWAATTLMGRFLRLVWETGGKDPAVVEALEPLLASPFCMWAQDVLRLRIHLDFAFKRGPAAAIPALAAVEPHVPWDFPTLRSRAEVYRRCNHPLAARAQADLEAFLSRLPNRFEDWFHTEEASQVRNTAAPVLRIP
ncbi:MAG: fused MFS/spermidine synthase [Acidobacteria bacterium]|nr:fused MFS/spermidine synthase [Acidobacteriota bacterium]